MSNASSNSQNTTQGGDSWLGTGISVFGGMMSSVNNFFMSQLKNIPMPSYVRGMMNAYNLMKDLITGAASGGAGQNNAANGVAAALVGTIVAGVIFAPIAGVIGGSALITAIVAGFGGSFVSMLLENYFEKNNINFFDPQQALSDIGNNALDGFNDLRDLISRLTDRDEGIANHLKNQDGSQDAFETLYDWADTLPDDLKQDLIDYLNEIENNENIDPEDFEDIVEDKIVDDENDDEHEDNDSDSDR